MFRWVKGFFVVTAVAMAGLIPAPAEPRLTFAQAGSTGGTIGKTDKSASGGEVPARARRAPVRKHHVPARVRGVPARQHHVSEAAPTRASCRNVTGTWSWTGGWFGKNDTVFSNDGTARHASGFTGTWTCLGDGVIFINWPNLGQYKAKLSPDGKTLVDADSGVAGFVR